MPSIGRIIDGHNKRILGESETVPPCKCTLYDCEVEGQCEQRGVIYQCEVSENVENQGGTAETYVGLTENSFKDRLTKHRTSFRIQGYHKNSLRQHIGFSKAIMLPLFLAAI